MSQAVFLVRGSRARYVTGSLMYFAQGIPQGLLNIALPAWLVSEGLGPSEIGSYLAILMLPWAFKLLAGPLMDRFGFPAMGIRRPWVIGAQAGLALSLLALMLITDPVAQIGLLSAIGFLVNVFAATQDVAVDGMAIDVTPVQEQGRLNGFMSFGKAIGWSVTAAVSGVLLTTLGLGGTAVVAAVASCGPLLVILWVREREGERVLPWTSGEAAAVERASTSFKTVWTGVNKVLWTRTSCVVLMIMFVDGLIYGYGQALMPIAAVKLFGFSSSQWSSLVASMGLVGAGLALAFGPLIDRAGAKFTLIGTAMLLGLHAIVLAQTQALWQDTLYVRVMLSLYVMMLPLVMVSSLALAMAICQSTVSATQFAIYMSMANVGHTVGSKVYGEVAESSTYVQSFTLLAVLVVVMIVVLFFHRHQAEPASGAGSKERKRRFTIGVPGSSAVVFVSGFMRCPKCRADMAPIDYDGVEVDRCEHCNGMWFDAGEIEELSNSAAAAALDTGDEQVGRELNAERHYECPRCYGEMESVSDKRQPHIHFESCTTCHGSFLDAGEFRDLAKLTVGEFFRSIVPRKPAP